MKSLRCELVLTGMEAHVQRNEIGIGRVGGDTRRDYKIFGTEFRTRCPQGQLDKISQLRAPAQVLYIP